VPFPFAVFTTLSEIAKKEGYQIYAVGGFVRDMAMGKCSDDIDFLVDKEGDPNPGVSFCNILENTGIGKNKALYENFGTAKIDINNQKVEFCMPRSEKYDIDNRKPEVEKIDIKGDAIRRDFTINTLMLDLITTEILDPTGKGLEDIKNKIIRSANPNVNQMLIDDPLRALRAIRLSATKGFSIDPILETAIVNNIDRIKTISKERINVELDKILMADNGDIWEHGVARLLLNHIIPEMADMMLCMESEPWHFDESVFDHTIRVIYNCPKDINLRRAALFHDIGKPKCRAVDDKNHSHYYGHEDIGATMANNIMQALRYSVNDTKIVSKIVHNHMRPHLYDENKWGDKAIRKLIVELGDLLEPILQLAMADTIGQSNREIQTHKGETNEMALRKRIDEIKGKPIHYKPIVNGDRIQKICKKNPGKWIKDAMKFQMETLYSNPEISIENMENSIFIMFGRS
jgi:putative nucleotidyltransferase with HDIG domain